MSRPLRLAYFGLPLGACLLQADGHDLGLCVLSPIAAPGRRRILRLLAGRVLDALESPTELEHEIAGRLSEGRFDLLTSPEQLAELARVTRYPKLRERLPPALAGRLVNELRKLAIVLEKLPAITLCDDPYDDYLLAMATAGNADFLVTGDKRDLLGLARYEGTRIVTVRDFLVLNSRLP